MKRSVKIFFCICVVVLASAAFTRQGTLTVTSSAFGNNRMIPSKYSCEGAEVNPPIKVTGIPAAAQSLALTVHDPDAPGPGGVTHWVVWNLPADGNIPENFKGGVQGLNSSNKPGYKGMCPPSGTHRYNFVVYALDTRLQLDANTSKEVLEKAMQRHILAQGQLTGLYYKTRQ